MPRGRPDAAGDRFRRGAQTERGHSRAATCDARGVCMAPHLVHLPQRRVHMDRGEVRLAQPGRIRLRRLADRAGRRVRRGGEVTPSPAESATAAPDRAGRAPPPPHRAVREEQRTIARPRWASGPCAPPPTPSTAVRNAASASRSRPCSVSARPVPISARVVDSAESRDQRRACSKAARAFSGCPRSRYRSPRAHDAAVAAP